MGYLRIVAALNLQADLSSRSDHIYPFSPWPTKYSPPPVSAPADRSYDTSALWCSSYQSSQIQRQQLPLAWRISCCRRCRCRWKTWTFFSVPYLVSAASAVVRRITELPALARTMTNLYIRYADSKISGMTNDSRLLDDSISFDRQCILTNYLSGERHRLSDTHTHRSWEPTERGWS